MQKCEFLDLERLESKKSIKDELSPEKYETIEYGAKDIPFSFRKDETKGGVEMNYSWPGFCPDDVIVSRLVIRKGDPLEGVYRVKAKDGEDTITVEHEKSIYLLRKTAKEVAEAIFRASSSIRAAIEDIIGYMRTLGGNFYIISKIPQRCWVFDRNIACGECCTLDAKKLHAPQKAKIFHSIVENIGKLALNGLVIKDFAIANVIITSEGAGFTDMRNLRMARKRSLLVEEFRSALKRLVALGLGGRAEALAACVRYCSLNAGACETWHAEKTQGKKGSESEVAEAMSSGI